MNNTTSISWSRLRQLVKRRDKSICHHCGKKSEEGHCDHLIPLVKGGTDAIDNLVWSCPSCNLKKGSKIIQTQENDELPDWLRNAPTVDYLPDSQGPYIPGIPLQNPSLIPLNFNKILSTIIRPIIASFISPYPQYCKRDYPDYSTYFEDIVYLKSHKITDWIRRQIWDIPRDVKIIDLHFETYKGLLSRVKKYHLFFDDALEQIEARCPECDCIVRFKQENKTIIHFICPAGHFGSVEYMPFPKMKKELSDAAIKWAAYDSNYRECPFPIDNHSEFKILSHDGTWCE